MFARLAAPFIVRDTEAKPLGARRMVFDIEADNLLDAATKIHCIVVADLDGDRVHEYGPDQIAIALEHLGRADCLIGHNITGYDLPLLYRLRGWSPVPNCTIIDTLVCARLILPNVDDLDSEIKARTGESLGKSHGRYSLEVFGARLGMPKVGAEIEDFSVWTPELQARCVGDVEICVALYRFLHIESYAQEAIRLEHRVSAICNRITSDGIPFDVEAAKQLRQEWTTRRAELETQLAEQFPDTNLNSRLQIGALLTARGWIPAERTKKTNAPKISDEVLESIPALYPEFTGLAEHYTLGRRLGQLANGGKAWLEHVSRDGRIHGAIIHIGTPHSRAAHFNPNIAQVPNPKRGKPLAIECRRLFHHPGDWVFVCCDQSGLQDRVFSHYLAEFDGGAYGRSFVAGVDTHWNSAIALGLIPPGTKRDKASKLHGALREGSKSFRYGFLFGMRAKRAGEIITTIIRAARQIEPAYAGPPANGALALRRFEESTPGLKQLRQILEARATHDKWLTGLDGRRVPVDAQYKALNRIVTAGEAIVCKQWLTSVHDQLCVQFRYGWDGDAAIVGWIHDELVVCCRPDYAKEIGAIMVRYAKEAGEYFGLKVPLDADFTIGSSWAGSDTMDPPDRINFTNGKVDPLDELFTGEAEPLAHQSAEEPNLTHHCASVENSAISTNSEHSEADGAGDQIEDDNVGAESSNGCGAKSSGADKHQHQQSGGYPHGGRRSGRRIAIYFYQDHLKGQHTRVEKWRSSTASRAQYPQFFWSGGRWVSQKPKGWTKIPYRLPEMLEALAKEPATDVYLPEGEKDCETLVALDLVATTNSEGATPLKAKVGKWVPELSRWFHGVRRLFVLADNDEVGRAFGREKARALEAVVPDIRIVLFPDVPEGEDVSYWLNELGHTKEELLARCEAAEHWQSGGYVLVRASDIVPRAMDWLWQGHILRGSQELLTGIPGNGKSQIHCAFVAYVTTGGAWPDGCNGAPAGNVIMLTAEDCLDQTIVPRLIVAGANRERVFILKKIRKDNKERMFLLSEDLDELAQMITKIGDVRLITIDPITAYMGHKLDSHRATDVRGQLGPLADLAERMDVALSAITHPPKHTTQRAIDHFIGSQAFIAAARIGHMTIEEIDEDEHGNRAPTGRSLFTNPKNNVSRKMSTLAYRVVEKPLDGGIKAPFITWEEIVDTARCR